MDWTKAIAREVRRLDDAALVALLRPGAIKVAVAGKSKVQLVRRRAAVPAPAGDGKEAAMAVQAPDVPPEQWPVWAYNALKEAGPGVSLSAAQVAEKTGLSARQAARGLKLAIAAGQVAQRGVKRGSRYLALGPVPIS